MNWHRTAHRCPCGASGQIGFVVAAVKLRTRQRAKNRTLYACALCLTTLGTKKRLRSRFLGAISASAHDLR